MNKIFNREVRTDRRDSQDEKRQKRYLYDICKNISKEKSYYLDMSKFNSVSHSLGVDGLYINRNGVISHSKGAKRNRFYDSKTFDAMATIGNDAKNVNLYFIIKYTKNNGGQQNGINYELAVTVDNIRKNNQENNLFFIVADGKYWDSVDFSQLELPSNCFVINEKIAKESIKTNLKNIL